jgi:hypothetical protein
MNYKGIKQKLIMIILGCPLILSAQISKEISGMKSGFSPKPLGYLSNVTNLTDQKSQFKKVFYGDIMPLKAGEQFRLDSMISYIFLSPFDSLMNKREVFSYFPDGKIEHYTGDSLRSNDYYSEFPEYNVYRHEEANYSYNAKGELILYEEFSRMDDYIYDYEGELLDFHSVDNSELIEDYDYTESGALNHVRGSQKIKSSDFLLAWTYEDFYNSMGLPDSGYATNPLPFWGPDTTFITHTYGFNEENKLIYHEEYRWKRNNNSYTIIVTEKSDTFQNAVVNKRRESNYSGGFKTSEREWTSISEFDEYGNRIKGWWYNYDSELKLTVLEAIDSLIYNENNQLKEIYAFGYGGGFEGDVHRTTFDYDQYGNLVQKLRYNRGFMDQWALYIKELAFYSAAVTNEPIRTISETIYEINVFPNPAHDFVWVSVPDTYSNGDRSLSGGEGAGVVGSEQGCLFEI